MEARLRRYDGVYRWFLIRVSPYRDESGMIARWYGTSTDIDDHKVAEEALRSKERDLSAIINTMPVLAWSAKPDGTVEFFNERWLKSTGFSPAQAQGWGWTEALHPDDLGQMTDYWRSIIATGGRAKLKVVFAGLMVTIDGSFSRRSDAR